MFEFIYDVYGLGNALVDHIVRVPTSFIADRSLLKGQMTELGMDGQKGILSAFDVGEVLRQGGGSAANTVVAAASLGARAGYACRVGSDKAGNDYLRDLKEAGVALSLAHLRKGKAGETGTCVVLVTPDGERTMLTHLGITKDFSIENIDVNALSRARYVYLEGYLVSTDQGFEAMSYARQAAKKSASQTALTLSDLSMVTHFRDRLRRLLETPVDLLFCNRDEALAFTETAHIEAAADQLKGVARAFIITQGGDDVYVYDKEGIEKRLPAYPARVLDTNGAGDIFAGATLYALSMNKPLHKAAQLGCWAAARLVERIGARLDHNEWQSVKKWAHENS